MMWRALVAIVLCCAFPAVSTGFAQEAPAAAESTVAAENAFIDELAGLFARYGDGKRLVVLPMDQAELPAAPEALGNAFNRVLSAAQERSGVRLSIQSQRAQMTAVLEDAETRGGTRRFLEAVESSVRGDADLGLAIVAGFSDAGIIEASASLHDLSNGDLLGTTDSHALAVRCDCRADPKTAIRTTLQRFLADIPEKGSRGFGQLPVTMEETGQRNSATMHFDQLIADGLSIAVNSPGRMVRQQAPEGVEQTTDASDVVRYYISGTVAGWDEKTAKLFISLKRGQIGLKSKLLFLSTEDFPGELRRFLQPSSAFAASGFDAFVAELAGFRTPDLRLSLAERKGNRSYEICPTPQDPTDCDRLVFRIESGRNGPFMCLVVGDDGSFGMLRPNPLFATQTALTAGVPLLLPDGRRDDGGEEVWYALGPPGSSLVVCARYQEGRTIPADALSGYNGAILPPLDRAYAARLIRESGPTAVAWSIVSIDEPFRTWR